MMMTTHKVGDLKMNKEPWVCHTADAGLSWALREHNYEGFMSTFESLVKSRYNIEDMENITVVCEGQCPKGCEKRFKMKLGKSITKTSFEKMFKHGMKYPEHCLVTN